MSFTFARKSDALGWEFAYEARSPDGRDVHVKVAMERGPEEGDTTGFGGIASKVSVRVGRLGDRELSKELLRRIEGHLRRWSPGPLPSKSP